MSEKKRKPYKVEKHWQAFGCECVVIMTDMGHRCGYAGIREKHPLYGCEYHDNSPFLEKWRDVLMKEEVGKRGPFTMFCWDGEVISPEIWFNVHFGLTFSGGDGKYPIELNGIWWYGYDCGHCDDKRSIPDISNIEFRMLEQKFQNECMDDHRVVRSLEYCITECENLAKQLSELFWLPVFDHEAKDELEKVIAESNDKIEQWIQERKLRDDPNGMF